MEKSEDGSMKMIEVEDSEFKLKFTCSSCNGICSSNTQGLVNNA